MAVAANKKRALRFGFVEDLFDSATWESTPGVLDAYIARHQSLGRQTSLVLFFKPTYVAHTIDDYYDRFWAVLQHLHDNDKQPWPEDLPVDPENPRWQFAYGGCAFFVVCSTPAHSLRRSRSNPGFLITFQPHRWVFEGLGGDTPRGISVRRTIRERLRRYDGIVPSSLLGVYGDDSNKEWQQYFLPDSDHGSWGACPFSGQGSSGLVEISSPGMPDDRQPPS
jgi:FPC/CPF motif-containing protein YcgG